jgi:hypothetical protein
MEMSLAGALAVLIGGIILAVLTVGVLHLIGIILVIVGVVGLIAAALHLTHGRRLP